MFKQFQVQLYGEQPAAEQEVVGDPHEHRMLLLAKIERLQDALSRILYRKPPASICRLIAREALNDVPRSGK